MPGIKRQENYKYTYDVVIEKTITLDRLDLSILASNLLLTKKMTYITRKYDIGLKNARDIVRDILDNREADNG